MKDVWEIFQSLGLPQSSRVVAIIFLVLIYLGYSYWKNFKSPDAILEREKRRLEVFKLSLEIAALEKQLPTSENTEAARKALTDTSKLLKKSVKQKKSRIESLKSFLVGSLTACLFPIVTICYGILHLPANTSADTLHVVVFFWLCFLVFTAIGGGVIAAIISKNDLVPAAFFGAGAGFLLYPIAVLLFKLGSNIWLVFLNAR